MKEKFYGRGRPGMDALPDLVRLRNFQRMDEDAIQHRVSFPWRKAPRVSWWKRLLDKVFGHKWTTHHVDGQEDTIKYCQRCGTCEGLK